MGTTPDQRVLFGLLEKQAGLVCTWAKSLTNLSPWDRRIAAKSLLRDFRHDMAELLAGDNELFPLAMNYEPDWDKLFEEYDL